MNNRICIKHNIKNCYECEMNFKREFGKFLSLKLKYGINTALKFWNEVPYEIKEFYYKEKSNNDKN